MNGTVQPDFDDVPLRIYYLTLLITNLHAVFNINKAFYYMT